MEHLGMEKIWTIKHVPNHPPVSTSHWAYLPVINDLPLSPLGSKPHHAAPRIAAPRRARAGARSSDDAGRRVVWRALDFEELGGGLLFNGKTIGKFMDFSRKITGANFCWPFWDNSPDLHLGLENHTQMLHGAGIFVYKTGWVLEKWIGGKTKGYM